MQSISKRIAWLCLLLTLWSVYVFSAHQHPNSVDAKKCTICVAAHSTCPVAISKPPHAVFVSVHLVLVSELVSAQQRLIAFALAVRPPPGS
jgi:hypothetical protein